MRGTFCSEELANAEQRKFKLNVLLFHHTHHVVNSQASVLVLEVQGLYIECSVQRPTVLNPRKQFSV